MDVYRALLNVYRALMNVYRAFLNVYKSLFNVYRALLCGHRVFLIYDGPSHECFFVGLFFNIHKAPFLCIQSSF